MNFFIIRMVAASALAVALPSFGSIAERSAPTAVEKDYLALNDLSRAHAMNADQASAMAAFYAAHFRPLQRSDRLLRLTPRELAALFRAASTTAFYSPTPLLIEELKADLAQLEREDMATPEQYRDVYGALYQARDLVGMASFAAAHGAIGLPPAVNSTDAFNPSAFHGVLTVVDDHTVRPRTVDLSRGANLVVISNPGCHFTRYAIDAIEHDPELKAMMAEHSVWVAPTDRNIDLAAFVAWNAAHAVGQIALADSKAGWPEVDVWQTPLFLYFKDGKVVDRVVGWPKEGSATEVKAAWARVNSDRPTSGKID